MKLFSFIVIFSLFASPAYASEVMEAGTVLENQSYVFSLDEAQEIRQELLTLEGEVAKLDELVVEYKALNLNLSAQVSGLEDVLVIKDLHIEEYQKLHQLDISRVYRLEKQNSFGKVERWGFLTLGMAITVGAIMIADKIDDSVESSNMGAPINSSRSNPLFRF